MIWLVGAVLESSKSNAVLENVTGKGRLQVVDRQYGCSVECDPTEVKVRFSLSTP